MGSTFRLPLWKDASFTDAIAWCGQHGIQTVGADVKANSQHTDTDWKVPRALIVGSESTGLSNEEVELANETVRVVMHGNVESLNVAVAAAVLLFEAARQRGH